MSFTGTAYHFEDEYTGIQFMKFLKSVGYTEVYTYRSGCNWILTNFANDGKHSVAYNQSPNGRTTKFYLDNGLREAKRFAIKESPVGESDLFQHLDKGNSFEVYHDGTKTATFYEFKMDAIRKVVGDDGIIRLMQDNGHPMDDRYYKLSNRFNLTPLQEKTFAIISGEKLFIRPFSDTPTEVAEERVRTWIINHLDQSEENIVREVTMIIEPITFK